LRTESRRGACPRGRAVLAKYWARNGRRSTWPARCGGAPRPRVTALWCPYAKGRHHEHRREGRGRRALAQLAPGKGHSLGKGLQRKARSVEEPAAAKRSRNPDQV